MVVELYIRYIYCERVGGSLRQQHGGYIRVGTVVLPRC